MSKRDRARNAWIEVASSQLDGSPLDPASAHVAEWFEDAYDGKAFRIIRQRLRKYQSVTETGFLRLLWAAAVRRNRSNPLAPIAEFFNRFNIAAPISQKQADEWLNENLQDEIERRPATDEQLNRYQQLYELGFFTKAEHARWVKEFGDEPTAAQLEDVIAKLLRRSRSRGKLPPCGERSFYPQFANCPNAKPVHIEYCRAKPVRRAGTKSATPKNKRATR